MRIFRTFAAILAAIITFTATAYADVAVVTMGSLPDELYPVFGTGQDASEATAYHLAIQDCEAQGGINCTFVTQTTEMGVSQTVVAGVAWGQLKFFTGPDYIHALQQCRNTWAAWCYPNTWAVVTANLSPTAIMDGWGNPPPPSLPQEGGGSQIFVAGLSGFSPNTIPVGIGATEQDAKDACAAKTPGGKQPCYLLKDPVDASGRCVIVGIFEMPNGMFEPHAGTTREQANANAGTGAKIIRSQNLCL